MTVNVSGIVLDTKGRKTKTPFTHLQVQTRGTDESACAKSITVKSDGVDRQAVGYQADWTGSQAP